MLFSPKGVDMSDSSDVLMVALYSKKNESIVELVKEFYLDKSAMEHAMRLSMYLFEVPDIFICNTEILDKKHFTFFSAKKDVCVVVLGIELEGDDTPRPIKAKEENTFIIKEIGEA
jgi:hypothetical protein